MRRVLISVFLGSLASAVVAAACTIDGGTRIGVLPDASRPGEVTDVEPDDLDGAAESGDTSTARDGDVVDARPDVVDAASDADADGAADTDGAADGATDGPVDAGPSAPTFTQVYEEIFAPSCANCHTPGDASPFPGAFRSGLNLTDKAIAYQTMVSVAGGEGRAPDTTLADGGVRRASRCVGAGLRVEPGNAAASIVYSKVHAQLVDASPVCGSSMPFQGAPLSLAQTKLIEDWINAGAKND